MQHPVTRAGFALGKILSVAAVFALGAASAWAQSAEEPAPRPFARGVLTTIPGELLPEETSSLHPVVEFRSNPELRWDPEYLSDSQTLFERAEQARFHREIWCLEFSFKPLRMIFVDVPQPNGQVERKLLWYMVYAVRNTGSGLTSQALEDGGTEVEAVNVGPVRFLPHFVLQGHDQVGGRTLYRAYLDKVIPVAMEPIRRRETPGRKLLNTVQMSQTPIPVSTDDEPEQVWGVAIWEEVDPKIDFFSVYVRGLTNAYRWEDPAGAYQAGDPPGAGRRFVSKTLQLNFWRPGDRFSQHETEIRYGVAPGNAEIYGAGVTEGLAHRWVYR